MIVRLNDVAELTAGYFQLNDDTTCSAGVTFRVTDSGNVTTETETTTCTWSLNGTAISITYSDGGTDTGSLIENRTLSITTSGGGVILFVK